MYGKIYDEGHTCIAKCIMICEGHTCIAKCITRGTHVSVPLMLLFVCDYVGQLNLCYAELQAKQEELKTLKR